MVDAKSPYTSRHSERVAETAVGIAGVLGLGAGELRDVRRAGLLHDLGKLGVPNSVLDKPGKLTPEEWAVMRRHPAHTAEVLDHVECLRPIAGTAASHHERPYHAAMPTARVLEILDADAGTRLDSRSIAALRELLQSGAELAA